MRLSFCVGLMVVCSSLQTHGVICHGQEAGNPAANPVDPAALTDAPLFGESGPVVRRSSPPPLGVDQSAPAKDVTDWKPRLQVVLQTRRSSTVNGLRSAGLNSNHPGFSETFDLAEHLRVRAEDSPQNTVMMFCDDVSVEVKTKPDGTLEYGFTCQGKAQLSINGNLIRGDSLTSDAGKLTFNNAIVQMADQVTLNSEKMVMTLPVFGISILETSEEHTHAESRLEPIPDVIGNKDGLLRGGEETKSLLPST